jgi:outer membrane immunogenic protein
MKKLFAAAIILSISAESAFSADLAAGTAGAAPTSWSGQYVGVDGGVGWLDGKASVPGASASDDFDGGLIGGFVGYNAQFNNVIVGVEGNVERNFNENSYSGVKVGTDLAGAVRARVGYAIDKALVYGAAGWTGTKGSIKVPGVGKETESFNGYTVGAGVDYALTDDIFARAEYRFNDYGSKNVGGVDFDLDQSVVKFGVAAKF